MTTDPKLDHPRVRQSSTCSLCYRYKVGGGVVCWRCYRQYDLRTINARVKDRLDRAEQALQHGEG